MKKSFMLGLLGLCLLAAPSWAAFRPVRNLFHERHAAAQSCANGSCPCGESCACAAPCECASNQAAACCDVPAAPCPNCSWKADTREYGGNHVYGLWCGDQFRGSYVVESKAYRPYAGDGKYGAPCDCPCPAPTLSAAPAFARGRTFQPVQVQGCQNGQCPVRR